MRTAVILTFLLLLAALWGFAQEQIPIHGSGEGRPFRQSDLVILATDGSGEFRLTDTLMREGQAAWSPDGSRVAFVGDVGRYSDLFVVNVDGSGLVNITNTFDIGEWTPSWSPDSRRILFSAGEYTAHRREGSSITAFSVDITNIYVVNADGSSREQLTNDESKNSEPVFSPDSRLIAFASDRLGLPEIFTMNADGSNLRRVTNSPEGVYCDEPSWSPSGVQLAYTRHEKSRSDIFVTNADASRTFRLTDTQDIESDPAWSPSGAWIAFCSGLSRAHRVYCIRPNGEDLIEITKDVDGHFTGPSWSPDQRFVVAQTLREPVKKRPLTAYTLWDEGGISISMAGDDTSRFIGATRDPDGSISTRPLTEADARAWFGRYRIPFPELSQEESDR